MKTTDYNFLRNSFLATLGVIAIVLFFAVFTYLDFRPGIVSAQSSASDTVVVTLNVTSGITISNSPDVSMSRTLGVAAHTAVASSTWTIVTNNVTGYQLTLKSTTTPAMKNATSSVTDYGTSSPAVWSVASGDARFGFSAYGADVSTATWGATTTCQTTSDTPNTLLKYLGFKTTDSQVVAQKATTTPFAGTDTTVCYAVQQNGYFIPSGVYTATIIATAVTI